MSIVLLEPIHTDAVALLVSHDQTLLARTASELEVALQQQPVLALLTRGRGRISDELMERCVHLRVVARCGVGLDNIDLAAARARGVPVIYAPGSTTQAVAEHTLLLMLALARQLRPTVAAVHRGGWEVRDQYAALELRGKTLGVLGLGAIGLRVAELAEAFGMRVISWGRQSLPRYQALPFKQVLCQADIMSLHVPLTPETRHLIGSAELALMKPGALLINTARGALIDQAALVAALNTGQLAGFAADVLDPEPPAANEPLLAHAHTLITPHIAALTDETFREMCVRTVRNVLAVLRGEPPEPASVYQPPEANRT